MPADFVIRTITIDEDGVSLEYVQPGVDIKANRVQQNHVLFIPRDDDYDDEIGAVEDAALYLLKDVLEDLPQLKAMKNKDRRTTDDDDDEEDD